MARVPLFETAYVTFNGSGNGTAKCGPLTARERWYPQNVSVSANANPTNDALCTILVGDANTRRQVDVSVSGSSGDSTDRVSGTTVRAGEFVWAVWSGGDANQRATMTVTGEKEV